MKRSRAPSSTNWWSAPSERFAIGAKSLVGNHCHIVCCGQLTDVGRLMRA
jgi:hypothetical protein